MECFFGSYEPDGNNPKIRKTLVCFSIPDAGIAFKAPFSAEEELHSEYASLLTLLEFIELNQKLFHGSQLQIFGNSLELVDQVNKKRACRYEFSELLRKALEYKKKYNYSLGWIPKSNNPSISHLFD